jgi:hypothetical protein
VLEFDMGDTGKENTGLAVFLQLWMMSKNCLLFHYDLMNFVFLLHDLGLLVRIIIVEITAYIN